MIFNKKIIATIFLFFSVIFKTEISYAEDFVPDIFDSMGKVFKITKVAKDYPAFVAGVKVGDAIIKINDQKVNTFDQISYFINNSKSETINLKIQRKGQIIDFKLIPKITSSNYKLIGISLSNTCDRTLDSQGNKIDFTKDQVYHECWHYIDLDLYNYIQKLKKSSPHYENYISEKIRLTKSIGSDYLNIKSIFNFKKANEYLEETYNLSKENISIVKKKSTYGFQVADFSPASIAFLIGKINLNLYENYYDMDFTPFIDHKKGLKYLTIASKNNHSEASHELGKLYLKGIYGFKTNEKKAFNLINKSTQLGRITAHKDLADFYLFGLGGVEKNYSKAMVHYKLGNIPKFSGGLDYYDIAVLYKNKRPPKDIKEYYGWLIKDLEKFKTITSIERTGYFAKLFLKNYSEAYKWYYICAQKIKSNDWNKHLFGKWEENINEDCSKELIFLEKNFLSEKEIKSAKTAAKDWLKKNIN